MLVNGARPRPRRGSRDLVVRGAEKNNLKHIDVTIPTDSLTVITGVSGSGKTSLAFDTIFAEGQARYVESLSTYARRFLGRMDKARVDGIDGLAPAIAIDQKNSGRSPRSTVATITEIYDYLRLLYARIGQPHCPRCGERLAGTTPTRLARELTGKHDGARLILTAPLYRPGSQRPSLLDDPAHLPELGKALQAQGFTRLWLDGELVELADWLAWPAPQRRLGKDAAVDLVIDRVRIRAGERKRLAEAIESGFEQGRGLLRLILPDGDGGDGGAAAGEGKGGATPKSWLVSEPVGCVACDTYQDEPFTPRMFSFNSHVGACVTCSGLGKTLQVDPALLVPFGEFPLLEGALVPGPLGQALARKNSKPWAAVRAFAKREGIDLERPFGRLSERQRELLLHGDGRRLNYSKRHAWSRNMRAYSTTFRGLTGVVEDWYQSEHKAKWAPHIEPVMADVDCPDCAGERLKPAFRAVTIADRNISQFCDLTVEEAQTRLAAWPLSKTDRQVAEQPTQEIVARLGFLKDVGLGYLTLNREATTLSGGEAQRIRLASQLGSALVGVLYVLDEPTIGLHPRDTQRLLGTLKRLRDLGNKVVVVEHDPETILAADHVIDIGPGAGHLGGEVVASCSPAALKRHPASLTGAYLSGRQSIPLRDSPRATDPGRVLRVRGARANNLKGIDVAFPLGAFTAVTGVSGSGKSSLVVSVLQNALARKLSNARVVPGAHDAIEGLEQVEKLVVIDQSPIGKTPKSNPATYSGMMDRIRSLMAQMPEARMRGYKPGRFSFNVKGGRCEACEGRGYNHIEMHFLADVWVPCDVCDGRRYNRETLQVRFRGKHMAEILDMEIGAALELFANQSGIRRGLQTLHDVGLGYMKLGQAGNTLSGGEAQRLKLAAELGRPTEGRSVYILDEPTTGLHLDDIAKLLRVLHRLVDEGNTVVLIEHNLDVIKTADWVIDLGPEGGEAGGHVVATGSPVELAQQSASHTGRALARHVPQFAAKGSGAGATKPARRRAKGGNGRKKADAAD
ncbi:MAG TPA: excinuclease ABC subunit UvrA [bacterium]